MKRLSLRSNLNLFDSVAEISKSSKFIVQLHCNRWSDIADCITVFRRFPVRLDYMKPKYNDNVKLCCMDTDSFIMNIKRNDFYEDIANDVENRFDTSNYEVNRPLPTGKNKKGIGLMKDELGGKMITEFGTLRPKTYSFLTDDGKEDKKAKGTKKCVIKKMIKFNDYKKCLLNDEVVLKS